jgi:O-antigen/teichoic acid export membrane protein
MLEFTTKYLFIIAVGFVFGTWAVGVPLMTALFGSAYEPSGLTLQLLNSSLIFSFWNFIGTNLLIATDRERLLAPAFGLGAIIHVAGNLLLINFFTHFGAGAAVVITQGLQFVIVWFFVRDHLPVAMLARVMAKPLLCGVILFAVAWPLSWYNVWLAIAIGPLVFIAALLLTGAARLAEFVEIHHLESPEKPA